MESDKKELGPAEPILEPVQKTVLPPIAGSLLIVVAIISIIVSVALVSIN